MTSRRAWIAGLMGVALAAPAAMAQGLALPVPGGAGAAAPGAASAMAAAGPGGGAVATSTAAAPNTLWSFLGLSKANLAACQQKLCQSQLGQAANSLITGPVSGVSGGFIPPLCPPAPSAAAVAALAAGPAGPLGAEAVAAKIKADEADAKARVAAVEYLATVDCSRWDNAKTALITSLRADPNECVRFAAARALNSGCCCSQDIIEALQVCVAGIREPGVKPDGTKPSYEGRFPAETSPRVKGAAFAALQNCLMRVPAVPVTVPEPEPAKPELGPPVPIPPIPSSPLTGERSPTTQNGSAPTHLQAVRYEAVPRTLSYQDQLRRKSYAETINEARRTLFEVSQKQVQSNVLPPGKQSVLHALIKARHDLDTRSKTRQPAAAMVPTDPGVRQSGYTEQAAPATSTAPVPPERQASFSNQAAPAPANGYAPAPVMDLNPVPVGTSDMNPAREPFPPPSTSYAPPPTPYKGGLLGALMRRSRRQADQ